MIPAIEKQPVTRRQAVATMLTGMAGVLAGRAKAAEREPATGVEILQVTKEEFRQSNIYCEVPYCSRDSRYFVYERTKRERSKNNTELMMVELGTWKQHRLDDCVGIGGSAITHGGVFYYLKARGVKEIDLCRVDLADGKPEVVHRRQREPRIRSLGTVSADGRHYAGGIRVGDRWKEFGILLLDLSKGEETVIDRDPYILNPHPQFEPGESRQLMIQHNRGGKYRPDGTLERLVGPEGATLYLLSVPGGKRTELQVGKPFTPPATGHEAWIGKTKEILLTVAATGDYTPEKGNLLGVRAGQPARVVGKGSRFNHVGVSTCGRFYSCDDWQGSYKIVVGSTRTGKSRVVCDSRTKPSRSQNTHPHAYLTPDLKWVIFNSNRSGFPHIYAARVPEGIMDELSTGTAS
jgi:hypothetical protein